MKAIIYLPTLIVNALSLLLPRWLFLTTYAPQSEPVRIADEQARNALRRADYYAKRALTSRPE